MVAGSVSVTAGGHVAPGVATGALTVGGVAFNAGSAFDIEIGGTTFNPPTQVDYDRLIVDNGGAGTATLGGTLNVSLINGFRTGCERCVSHSSATTSSTGTFAATNLPSLGGGNSWQLNYLSDGVELKVVAGAVGVPGDFNNNGVVDAADYVLWRNGGPLQNEVSDPGVVNAQDYTDWRARFGNTSGSGSGLGSSSAVPEPTTLSICGLALLLTGVSMRKGRQS